jgi:hypothetical protein
MKGVLPIVNATTPFAGGDANQRTTSTVLGQRFNTPSATLPNSNRWTPLALRAPTATTCARALAASASSSRNGSPAVTTNFTRHPWRLRSRAACSCAAVAPAIRSSLMRLTSAATLARTPAATSACDGTPIRSTTVLRFSQHAFRGRLVNDDDVSVWPSPGQWATRGASRHIGGLIEGRQQYRSLMLSLDASRDHRPHASRFGPREQHGGRRCAPSLDGTITRNQDVEGRSRQLRHLIAILFCSRLTHEGHAPTDGQHPPSNWTGLKRARWAVPPHTSTDTSQSFRWQ